MGHVALRAQEAPKVDVAIGFVADRSLKANTNQNFWMEGGSIELGANAYKGFGLAAHVSGTHSNSIGTSGIPISLVTAVFGPRYRFHADHKVSYFGEVLLGEANGFNTIVPAPGGAQTSANSLALQVGGGIDYRVKQHLAIRVLNIAWIRTQIPNSTDNVQNDLRVGAGVVFRFGR